MLSFSTKYPAWSFASPPWRPISSGDDWKFCDVLRREDRRRRKMCWPVRPLETGQCRVGVPASVVFTAFGISREYGIAKSGWIKCRQWNGMYATHDISIALVRLVLPPLKTSTYPLTIRRSWGIGPTGLWAVRVLILVFMAVTCLSVSLPSVTRESGLSVSNRDVLLIMTWFVCMCDSAAFLWA